MLRGWTPSLEGGRGAGALAVAGSAQVRRLKGPTVFPAYAPAPVSLGAGSEQQQLIVG